MWLNKILTDALVRYVSRESRNYEPFAVSDPTLLSSVLQTADILLVEGNQRFSTAVKYLTRSTWSHAAIYAGAAHKLDKLPDGTPTLIEADLKNGVIAVPLAKYANFNTRICRPVSLTETERDAVVLFMRESIGMKYDLKNVIDLARYLIPTPPVPSRWRRSLLALGSGDPTRAICSTRIAQAFQSIRYPILPNVEHLSEKECEDCKESLREVLRIRHHSLFTPRDFDLSPYFQIIKPTVQSGFDHHQLNWQN